MPSAFPKVGDQGLPAPVLLPLPPKAPGWPLIATDSARSLKFQPRTPGGLVHGMCLFPVKCQEEGVSGPGMAL